MMYRYKLVINNLFGVKSPLEKSVEKKLYDLENDGMIDMMYHQFNRFSAVQLGFVPKIIIWKRWIKG